MRLTAHEGDERFARVSPDGKWIAFTAQYDGNDDVYVMSAEGGEPERLTYHPAQDIALGWTADGKVIFRSRRDHAHGDFRIFTQRPTESLAEMLPLEPAAWISMEPRGARVAYQMIGLEFHAWKRYKGGEAEQIYVGTLEPLAFTEVTQYDGKDAFPMWADDGRIYFVTDRWGRPNLASMKPDGSDVKRHTTFEDFDVRWPALGGGKIVYQHAMDVWAYDLASGRNEQVAIRLPSDRLQTREKFVDPMRGIGSWSLSKDGERIAIETRGDVFVARTKKKGLIRRVTESSISRTKTPAFAPDGKWIAAWTEVDGEEQLLLHSADNSAPPRQLGTLAPGWHFAPAWSPDGTRLAWGNERFQMLVTDVAAARTAVVDSSRWEITEYAWSPDGRFLAYTATLDNYFGQIRVWDRQTGGVHNITDAMFNSYSPSWDAKGKFLYILSDRYTNPYLDRYESRFIVDNATRPYVIALGADGKLPFPALGDSDEDANDEEDDDEDDGDKNGDRNGKGKRAGKSAKDDKPAEPVKIDFAGIADRIVEVPVEPGNLSALRAVDGKLHWLESENEGMRPPSGGDDDDEDEGGSELMTYDIKKEKLTTLASGVRSYAVSGDGEVLVYRTEKAFTRVEAGAAKAPDKDDDDDSRVELSGWSLRVDPRQEWKQMLREAWRLQRDFFYDPKMHGVDWAGVWNQYGPLADRIATRDDLNDLLGEVLGELNVGHAYRWGGDMRTGKPVGTGLLGADLDYDPASGFWRIRKIYRGDYPDPEWSSPLARADLRVTPGMWLVAIDGKPLAKGEDYLRRLANRAEQEVELSINDAPKVDGARRIVVKTLGGDTRIRYASWIRENRAYVDSVSNGTIGYLHLYDMGGFGLSQFARDYPPQWHKRGFIIDDRWNHGGFVATMILTHLDRKTFSVGKSRHGLVYTSPDRCFSGHLACLINRQGGSDCETFAQGFKDWKLGPVIGTRTWGGWVGIRSDKTLRDGGMTTQPEFSGWDPLGKSWQIEGHGVDPDVLLDLNPDGLANGNDVQLDYAIKDLMAKIAKDPRTLAEPPPIVPRPLTPSR
ncbi:MAG: PDZ domain-containing protein [bacterium]